MSALCVYAFLCLFDAPACHHNVGSPVDRCLAHLLPIAVGFVVPGVVSPHHCVGWVSYCVTVLFLYFHVPSVLGPAVLPGPYLDLVPAPSPAIEFVSISFFLLATQLLSLDSCWTLYLGVARS